MDLQQAKVTMIKSALAGIHHSAGDLLAGFDSYGQEKEISELSVELSDRVISVLEAQEQPDLLTETVLTT